MTKRSICVVAVIGAGLMAVAPVAPADPTDSLLASVGQFQLDSSETKLLRRGAAVKGYKICMDEHRHAVPLKVMYDGQEAIVEPGECRLFEATKIKLASAGPLHDGMTLIGSFGAPRSGKSYRTDVSVAQAAR
ncbi:MAG: hypothetical protein ABL989_14320, partial [Gammaproteobacteria bacterium]